MKKICMLFVMLCLLLTGCNSEYYLGDSLNRKILSLTNDRLYGKDMMFYSLEGYIKHHSEAAYETKIDLDTKYYICAYANDSIKETLDNISEYHYGFYLRGINEYMIKYYNAWCDHQISFKEDKLTWIKIDNIDKIGELEGKFLVFVGEVKTLKIKHLKENKNKNIPIIYEFLDENGYTYDEFYYENKKELYDSLCENPHKLLFTYNELFDLEFVFATELYPLNKYSAFKITKHYGSNYIDMNIKNKPVYEDVLKNIKGVTTRDGFYLVRYNYIKSVIRKMK